MPITVGGGGGLPYIAPSAPDLSGLDKMIQAHSMMMYAHQQREAHFQQAFQQKAQFHNDQINQREQLLQQRLQAVSDHINQRAQAAKGMFDYKLSAQDQAGMQRAQNKLDSIHGTIKQYTDAMNDPNADVTQKQIYLQRINELQKVADSAAQQIPQIASKAVPVPIPPKIDPMDIMNQRTAHYVPNPDGTPGPAQPGPLPAGVDGYEKTMMFRGGQWTFPDQWHRKTGDPEETTKMKIAAKAQEDALNREQKAWEVEQSGHNQDTTRGMHNDATAQAAYDKRINARAKEIRSNAPEGTTMTEPQSREKAINEIGPAPTPGTYDKFPGFQDWRKQQTQKHLKELDAGAAQQPPQGAPPAGPAPEQVAGGPQGPVDAAGEMSQPDAAPPTTSPQSAPPPVSLLDQIAQDGTP